MLEYAFSHSSWRYLLMLVTAAGSPALEALYEFRQGRPAMVRAAAGPGELRLSYLKNDHLERVANYACGLQESAEATEFISVDQEPDKSNISLEDKIRIQFSKTIESGSQGVNLLRDSKGGKIDEAKFRKLKGDLEKILREVKEIRRQNPGFNVPEGIREFSNAQLPFLKKLIESGNDLIEIIESGGGNAEPLRQSGEILDLQHKIFGELARSAQKKQ